MPTNPLPFQCGTPGCNRKFAKPENLRQHTKDFHSPSRPPPSRPPPSRSPPSRPPPSRPPPSRPPPSRPSSSRSPPSGPPPKQQTFKCGAPGCERRAPFSQLSLLHQHTAQSHPKSNNNTSSGSSTSAVQRSISAFSRGHRIPVTNTRSTRAPVLRIQHLPPQVQYMSPYVYSHQPSASTSLAAQNAVASSDDTLVAVRCLLKI
ncbi:hypothetical protein C8R44DRAFT_226581 [Mycena epipterygia]|nr:hypothetical protein C8R44DRAFT_226581 [Mycena epipterygia]